MDFIKQIWAFLKEVWNAIIQIDTWIWDLANKIKSIDVVSTVSYPLGVFRYFVGDTAYVVFVSALYFGLVFFIIKAIKFLIKYIKTFNPIT